MRKTLALCLFLLAISIPSVFAADSGVRLNSGRYLIDQYKPSNICALRVTSHYENGIMDYVEVATIKPCTRQDFLYYCDGNICKRHDNYYYAFTVEVVNENAFLFGRDNQFYLFRRTDGKIREQSE